MTKESKVPRFIASELMDVEDSARCALLNEDGALHDPGHWLGLVIDLARGYRFELEQHLHG